MRSFLIRTAFIISVFVVAPFYAHADTLYISPSSGSYSAGKTFPIRVLVSSTVQPINAVSGVLSFPQDKLQVVSVSKTDSILTLWVQEPSFSNTQGTVSFEGVVPNPGFTGSSGRVVTINFKVVGQGAAPVRISSGSVLANDGNGTNILKNIGTASFSLGSSPVPAVTETADADSETDPRAPGAPVITSDEFPDSNIWYAKNAGTFSWKLGDDVTGTKLLLGKISSAQPSVVYDPAVDTKKLDSIEDGLWYLHVQLKNKYGWGVVTHHAFRVDQTKPETFVIRELVRTDTTDPRGRFSFQATDGMSGINHYSIQMDGGEYEDWRDDGSGVYVSAPLPPGSHTLVARAYDEASNYAVASVDWKIDPISAPHITSYTENVSSETPLRVSGNAVSNAKIHLYLARGENTPLEVITKSDSSGEFSTLFEKDIARGTYRLWAVAEDKRGARSEPSSEKTVNVRTGWFISIATSIMSMLAIAIPIAALLFALVFVILYGIHKIRAMRRGVRKELREVENLMDKAFVLLKEDIEDSVRLLERAKNRRRLTQEEDAIIERFRQNLADAEKVIKKEIHDVERKIEEK
jgi:hypothetical protein